MPPQTTQVVGEPTPQNAQTQGVTEQTPTTTPVQETTPASTQQAAPAGPTPAVVAELEWYRTNFDLQGQRLKELEHSMEEYETSAMSDEERVRHDLEKQKGELTQQQQRLAEAQYAQELYSYYGQFVPPNMIVGNSPKEWQHSVLTKLQGTIREQQAQIEVLKRAAVPGQNPPKVGTGSGGTAPRKKTVWEMTPAERKALSQRAQDGLTTKEDFLPVE